MPPLECCVVLWCLLSASTNSASSVVISDKQCCLNKGSVQAGASLSEFSVHDKWTALYFLIILVSLKTNKN